MYLRATIGSSRHLKCGKKDTVVVALVSMADPYQWRVFTDDIPELAVDPGA